MGGNELWKIPGDVQTIQEVIATMNQLFPGRFYVHVVFVLRFAAYVLIFIHIHLGDKP